MDFKPFEGKSDDGAVMTVVHPGTGELTDARITLAGVDSRRWRQAGLDIYKQNLQEKKGTIEEKVTRGLERIDDNKADLLASATISWENVDLDGKELKCTHANARKLFTDYPWLLEQVNSFVVDRFNFFRSVDASGPEGDEGTRAIVVAAEE